MSIGISDGGDPPETTTEIIDRLPLGRTQVLILMLVFAIATVDMADLQLLAFAAPAILADWGATKIELTPALSAALIGMIFGALAGGYFGDRIGRKRTLLASALIMGVATIATGFATDLTELTITRFIAGIGYGAVTPTAYTLGIEALPQRSRTWVSAVFCFVSALGGVLGSFVALLIIPAYGWQAAFIFCGSLSLVLGLLILIVAPESASFLFARNRVAQAEAAFRRTMGAYRLPHRFVFVRSDPRQDHATEEAPSLFSKRLFRTTLGAWLVYFGTAFTTFACLNWLPTILTNNQWSYVTAVQFGGFMNAAGILGTLVVAITAHLVGTRNFLLMGSLLSAIVAFWLAILIPRAVAPQPPLFALIAAGMLLGFANAAVMAANLAVVGSAYPVSIRSRGVGYAVSWMRVGSGAATLVMGAVLHLSNDNLLAFFGVVAFVAILIAVGGITINIHIPGRIHLKMFSSGPADLTPYQSVQSPQNRP